MERKLEVPIKDESLSDIKAGDVVYLTGNILTARDQAHKRIIEQGAPLDIEGAVLFHAGPIITEKDGNYEMVAIGPTTSMRMRRTWNGSAVNWAAVVCLWALTRHGESLATCSVGLPCPVTISFPTKPKERASSHVW